MNDERIDFSPIDPTKDEARFEETISSIVRDAEVELERRQGRLTVVGQVGQWWWPLLAAATVIIVVSLGVLWQLGGNGSAVLTENGIEESLGVPSQVATWIRSDELPTTSDLLETIEVSQ
ncbi:MAG: hypothetical protein HKM89_09110 [Gemmatimonadales bacterium]|nr:hypothetical protein [Gemmatimonadales bacterium]